ncbi:MAG: hypothetical protein PHN78_00390 [Dehalococcoidales bacterium]|nr:hypothetical protein [Dehalococcoidales bacterium]
MKKTYLPIIALFVGFGMAFLAAGGSSYFFMLLPVLAFAFGYFSSWRWGLLCGFLLFAGYTFTISLIWLGIDNINLYYPIPYIGAFLAGGFSILLIGALAPQLRKGAKRAGSITALAVLVIFTGWAGYTAVPHYSYYYQVAVLSSENVNNLELYLPVGTVSGEPYVELYDHVLDMPGDLTKNFTQEIVATERGQMLKITIPELEKDDVPVPRYAANIIFWYGRGFWQKIVPFELIQLSPKSGVNGIETVTSQRFFGSVKSRESRIIERFSVPVKASADIQAQINLTMWNRTDRGEALNFTYTYSKSDPYTERIDHDIQTDGGWKSVPVEATSVMEIRGISD